VPTWARSHAATSSSEDVLARGQRGMILPGGSLGSLSRGGRAERGRVCAAAGWRGADSKAGSEARRRAIAQPCTGGASRRVIDSRRGARSCPRGHGRAQQRQIQGCFVRVQQATSGRESEFAVLARGVRAWALCSTRTRDSKSRAVENASDQRGMILPGGSLGSSSSGGRAERGRVCAAGGRRGAGFYRPDRKRGMGNRAAAHRRSEPQSHR